MPSFNLPKAPHGQGTPGVLPIQQLAKLVAPKVELVVSDLIRRFDGLTLSVDQFNYLANSNLAVRRLLANSDNYAEAYKQLVLRPQRVPPAVLERNDGSFQSVYPPIMNPRANTVMVGSREQSKARCRCCGREGHLIAHCPDFHLLRDNRWLHTRSEQTSNGWNQTKYYFGPYPNEKWGIFPGGGFAPKAFDSEVLEWILKSLKDRFQVTDDQLKRPIQTVLPNWFDAAGKPVAAPRLAHSGESYTVETSEEGELLAQQTMALRAAAMFLDTVTLTREVHDTEPGVYAVETRQRGGRKAADQHRKDSRTLGKKPAVPTMKSSRASDLAFPSIEGDDEPEILRHRPEVDIRDAAMQDAQVDPLRELSRDALGPSRDTRSATLGTEVTLPPAVKAYRKAVPISIPTAEDLAALARNTSSTVIAQAMLNQEVRGLRQVDLLGTPEVAAAISKAIEDARETRVRFRSPDRRSGETMSIRETPEGESISTAQALQRMYDWGSSTDSGETHAIGIEVGAQEVITSDVLRRLCPRLTRDQRASLRNAEEANELYDFQTYEVQEEEDGYVEEQSKVPTTARLREEAQQQRYAIKGQLPTCWISLHGGMGRALIDTGSQLNVMRLSTARALNVYITELDQSTLPIELQQGMITADGGMDPFVGTAYQVPIMIGGIVIPTHFRIVRRLRRAILLGTPWCSAARLQVQFDTFGRALCYIKSPDGHREISFVGCDPAPTANSLSTENQGNE